MSTLRFSAATLALAGLASYSNLSAQQTTPQTQLQQPQQTQEEPREDFQQGQQRNLQQGQQQSDLSTSDQATDQQRYEARKVSPDSQQQGLSIQEAIIKKLQLANRAEIELATLAQQRSDNQEVQQLATMLIEDHKALNEKLGQISSSDQGRTGRSQSKSTEDATSRTTAGNAGNQFGQTTSQAAQVPQQMCKIMEQAGTNSLQMTKQMLQEYEGQDFQMAFLGQQLVAHTTMLADLRAIESTGPQELQGVVQHAIGKTEGHLEQIKQLARKLQDDTKKTNRR